MNHNGKLQSSTTLLRTFLPDAAKASAKDRWAIILAGGEGTRLRSLTKALVGDERPKQFCSILGDETLLAQTRRRAALVVKPTQTLFSLTRTHERFYSSLLEDVPEKHLVVQPKNAGTAPAILYSLLRLSDLNPDASVVVFPSDHYVSDNNAFVDYLETAFDSVRFREELIVLLGIKPDRPETEYGWIEPVSTGSDINSDSLSWVRRFWEKPSPEIARDLMKRGCLWNSFVMMGEVSSFLTMIERTVPDLFGRFRAVEPYLNTPDEVTVINEFYSELPEINFSEQVLAARPGNLAVLPITGLTWNDLGTSQRVLSTMAEIFPPKMNQLVTDLGRISASA